MTIGRQTGKILTPRGLWPEPSGDVTALLHAWTAGDVAARDRLMSVVYRDLRRRAAAYLRRERAGDTLQPTALVHEAYLRLVDQRRVVWQNRGQFFGVAAQMMRRILVDRARARKMAKRSGQWARVTVDDAARATPPVNVDVLDLDAALVRLAAVRPAKVSACGTPVFWRVVACGRRRGAGDFTRDGGARLAGGASVAVEGIAAGAQP